MLPRPISRADGAPPLLAGGRALRRRPSPPSAKRPGGTPFGRASYRPCASTLAPFALEILHALPPGPPPSHAAHGGAAPPRARDAARPRRPRLAALRVP